MRPFFHFLISGWLLLASLSVSYEAYSDEQGSSFAQLVKTESIIENILVKVGDGAPIAFNVLYVGRYKLGVTTGSGAKYVIDAALDFATERKQFNRSVKEFAIAIIANRKIKIGHMKKIFFLLFGEVFSSSFNLKEN